MKSTGHISINKYYLQKKDSLYSKLKSYLILILLSTLVICYFTFNIKNKENVLSTSISEDSQILNTNENPYKITNNYESSTNFSLKIQVDQGDSHELEHPHIKINDALKEEKKQIEIINSYKRTKLNIKLQRFILRLKNFITFNKRRPKLWKIFAKSLFYSSSDIRILNGKEIELYYNNFLNIPLKKININNKYSDDFEIRNKQMCSKLNRGKIFLKVGKSGSHCLVFKNLQIINQKPETKVFLKFFLYKRQPKSNKIILNHKKLIEFRYPMNEGEYNGMGHKMFADRNNEGSYFRVCNLYSKSEYLKYGTTNIMINFKLLEVKVNSICYDEILQVPLD